MHKFVLKNLKYKRFPSVFGAKTLNLIDKKRQAKIFDKVQTPSNQTSHFL